MSKEKELEVENQRPDEEVIFILRQHPWVLARPIFYLILISLIVLGIFLIFGWNAAMVIIFLAAITFVIIYSAIFWYSFANDLFVLTNQRLIKIDQKGLFSRKVAETELDNISNTNFEVKGIIKSLLNFGDIQISTAGDEISVIVIKNIENPHFLQEKIMDFHKKYKNSK